LKLSTLNTARTTFKLLAMPRRKLVKAEADVAENGNAKSNGNQKISLAKKKKLKQKQRKQAQKAER
jgi:hypothetical protein